MRTSLRSTQLRVKLEAEKSELREALSRHEENDRPNIGLGNHMADDGTEAFEQAASLALRRNQERMLERVEHALGHMESGTYGLCERCGEKIDYARLEAIPYATRCINCKPRAER
ncbi:MAG TPA: TraR/DksA C4-type zinc finger protein [Anaerolineae bacterium]|nr:TraR/DksA C4-type zinc finger protein [Anaerolineae bacterium]